jgi:hypothetical protein
VPTNTCQSNGAKYDPFLLVVIKSDVNHLAHRMAIRTTWGKASKVSLKFVFLLGYSLTKFSFRRYCHWLFIRRYVNHTVTNKKHNQRISQSHYYTRTFPAHIPLFNVKYLPLFHHFKAIYQFPKHIIAWVKIVANASLIYSSIVVNLSRRTRYGLTHTHLRDWQWLTKFSFRRYCHWLFIRRYIRYNKTIWS